MSNFRKQLVRRVWDRLDKECRGIIDINEIREQFDARNHPDVKQGKRLEEEVLDEFLETFNQYH